MAKKKIRRKIRTTKSTRKRKATSKSPFEHHMRPRVDLRLAYGNITEVDSHAVVVGLFQGIQELSQAARAIDERIGGAITDIIQRRMFLGKVGEIFILPAVRQDIRADLVICAGMGRFDKFDPGVLQTVAENVARTLVRAKVDEFAIVLFGATRGNLYSGLANLVDGFFRGVAGSRARNPLRSITVCETDRRRCGEIESALAKLYKTRRSERVEVTLEKITLPKPLRAEAAAAPRSVILQTTQEPGSNKNKTTLRLSVLATGAKATAFSETISIDESSLNDLVAEVDGDKFVDAASPMSALKRYGEKLAKTVLPRKIATLLKKVAEDRRIVLVHDTGSSRIPWETLCIDGWFPAAGGGMSRQYIADHMPIARFLEQRRYGKEIDVLLIVNPTKDLPGAVKEGRMVEKVARRLAGVKLTVLFEGRATKTKVKTELQSGAYDVLHYAGHTAFYPDDPSQTGIICAHEKVLRGDELAGMTDLPALVFFDSCESARVGGLTQKGARGAQRNIGLAECFLRSGVANYVGTHWVVSDDAAPAFVEAFYGALLQGKPIGEAVSSGRHTVRKLKSRDWADYIHYGSPEFVLKFPHGETSR